MCNLLSKWHLRETLANKNKHFKLSNCNQILALLINRNLITNHILQFVTFPIKAAQFRKPHMYALRTYFSFLFFLLQWLTFYWACLQLKKNFLESVIEMGNIYHGAARCSGRKFWSEFFAQLFEHFCAYLRLPWADHSDQGIIRKIFPSCRSWV